MQKIDINAALQAHPEFLNEKIDDHDKAIYAKGWNDCNKEYYNAISELPVASIDCTDLSMRLRRAFEADELTNHRLLLESADAIEELLARDVVPTDFHERCLQLEIRKRIELEKQMPHWISVEERLPEEEKPVFVTYIGYNTGSLHSDMIAYQDGEGDWRYYDGDNGSDICKVDITHWMPLPEPPKEDA